MPLYLTTQYERQGDPRGAHRRWTGDPNAAPSDNLAAALVAVWRTRCQQALAAERYWRERCARSEGARLFGLLILSAVTVLAGATAADATGPTLNHCIFTWTEATVPTNDLAVFTLYVATLSGGPYTKLGIYPGTPSGGQTYGPTPNLCVGQSDGQKFAVVKAMDTAGNESGASNEVPFAFDATVPPAASNLGVQ